jgi:hypothetical protein
MNDDLAKHYEAYNKLFRTKGWKQLQAELKNSFESTNSVETTNLEEGHLSFRKGQLNVLSNLINFETSIVTAQEAAEAEAVIAVEGESVDPLEA